MESGLIWIPQSTAATIFSRVSAPPPAGARFDPEWRLYARGAADDKAPIVALMTAIDAVRAAGVAFKSHVKFAFEGEEEGGSRIGPVTGGAGEFVQEGDGARRRYHH